LEYEEEMTTALERLLEKGRELNENRTFGKWCAHRTTNDDGGWLIAIDAPEDKNLPGYLWHHTGDADSNSWNDGEFVAHAANTYEKLLKIIELQSDILKKFTEVDPYAVTPNGEHDLDSSFHWAQMDARQALQVVEELAKKELK
jgi:hypothetical protein